MSSVDSLVQAFLGIAGVLRADFDRIASAMDLSSQGAAGIIRLSREDAMKIQDLAQILACDAGNLSGTIDRLEEASLVERIVSTADRRVRLLRLTARGRRVAERLGTSLAQSTVQRRLDAMSPTDRERLAAMLSSLLPKLQEGR